jgi:hypothetical protein
MCRVDTKEVEEAQHKMPFPRRQFTIPDSCKKSFFAFYNLPTPVYLKNPCEKFPIP